MAFGLPPMVQSDAPRMTRRQKIAFVFFLLVAGGLGIASVFGNLAEIAGAWAVASVLLLIGLLIFMIRRSRPAKKTESPS